jgi:hypothetical protein
MLVDEVGGIMKKISWLMVIIIALLLAGCSNAATPTAVLEASATEVIPTQATVTPSRTNTNVPGPTQVTTPLPPIWTPTVSITPYPVQNLTESQKMVIMDVLNQAAVCPLPCWNGLIPGVSRPNDIQKFLAMMGLDINTYKDNDINKNGFGIELEGYPSLNERFWLTIYFEEGIISEVEIRGWNHPKQYEISRIVNILGQPDSIRINNGAGGVIPTYEFVLLYPEKGVIFETYGKLKMSKSSSGESTFLICANDHKEQSVTIRLFSDEIKDKVLYDYSGYDIPWLDWANSIGISKDELIKDLGNPSKCIREP